MKEVQCELQDMFEYSGSGGKSKKGRYHGSIFHDIPGFGKRRWVVAARLLFDSSNVSVDYDENELASACVAFLNKPPPRQKFAKRQPFPKYGKLELYRAHTLERDGPPCLSVLLVVDDIKNPNFWGKGTVLQ